jgi:hypothetical protein
VEVHIDTTAVDLALDRIQHNLLHVIDQLERLETRMATLEEVTVALVGAVDRIGVVLTDTNTVALNAQAAADAAGVALAASEAADMADDAAFAQQVADLQAALAAAQGALASQAAAQAVAVDTISAEVAALNALGAPVAPPVA